MLESEPQRPILASPVDACPKRMTYGPCAGVTPDGDCEVPGLPCPFVRVDLPIWDGASAQTERVTPAGRAFLQTLERRPVIVTDMPAAPVDADSIRKVADALAGAADAVLLGDHGGARVQFPPAYRAMLVRQAGLEPWVGLNCRDRNRVALEGELAALEHANVAGVHALTGDHPSSGHRPDAMPVFDLDSTRLAALARRSGVLVSVAESPLAIPVAERPQRLAQKVKAGAQVCFVNHAGSGQAVGDFVAQARALGADVPFIAGVAVITSLEGARQIQGFRNLVLPPGYLEGILEADDTRRAGIAAAISLGETMLAQPGVRGLNLSSVPGPGRELELAHDLARVARAFMAG
jgi:methylenetetrahydrofolate reductase (NADPH)